MSGILIFAINPVSCHLIPFFIQHYRYRSMLNSGIDGAPKNFFYVFRISRSGNIPVLRHTLKEGVSDTPSYCISFKACFLQLLNYKLNMLWKLHYHTFSRFLFFKELIRSFGFCFYCIQKIICHFNHFINVFCLLYLIGRNNTNRTGK